MIAAVIRWSARNVMLVLIGAALLAAAGIYAVRQVPLDAIPDLSDTQVIVYTEYAGRPRRWSRTRSPFRCRPPC